MRTGHLSCRVQGNSNHTRNGRLIIMAAVAAMSFKPGSAAAGSTWVGPGGTSGAPNSGSWSGAGNWLPNGIPGSGAGTELDFTDGSSAGYISTDDLAGGFGLNLLNINSSNSSIAANAGSSLSFNGTNPTVNQTGGVFTVSAPVNFSAPTTIQQVNGAELDLTGNLSGSALTLTNSSGSGNSTVKLTGNNTISGLNVGAHVTAIAPQTLTTKLGSGAVTLSGGKLILQGQLGTGFFQQPISVSGFNADTIDDATSVTNGPTNSVGVQLSEIDNQGQASTSHLLYQNGYSNGPATAFTTPGGYQGGLPSSGTFNSAFTNINGGHTQFNFAYSNGTIDYTKNNTLYFTKGTGVSGNTTLPGPGPETLTIDGGGAKMETIDILAMAQNTTTLDATVNYSDGSSTTFTGGVTTGPWAFGTAPANVALSQTNANGTAVRFKSSARNVDTGYGWRFTESDLTLDPTKTVTSITFTPDDPNMGGGSTAEIFALSGQEFINNAPLATQTYSNDVAVTADSNIDISGSLIATVGNLSIGSKKLSITSSDTTVVPYSLTTASVTLSGNAIFDVANTAGGGAGALNLGALNDGGTARTITINPTSAGSVVLTADATSLVQGTVVNIQNGVLNSNSAAALGTTAQVNLSGGTFLVSKNQTISSLGGAGGTVSLPGTALTVGSSDALSGSYGGTIVGTGSLVVGGGATVTLSGQNTFTGGLFVANGTAIIAGNTTYSQPSVTAGPAGTKNVMVGTFSGMVNSALMLDAPGRTFPNPVSIASGNSGITTVGGQNTSGVVTFTGDITLGSGITGDYGHNVTFAAPNGGEVDFTGNVIANLGTAHSVVTTGNLSGTGNSTIKFTGNNTYAGGTIIAPYTTLVAGLTSSANSTLGTGTIYLGGKLSLQGQLSHGTQQTLTTTGYNASLIVPNDASSAFGATTTTIDGGDVFYQEGYLNTFDVTGKYGLNDSGLYTSQYNPNVQFQLQPYHGSTALALNNATLANNSGTLTLSNPGKFKTIDILSDTGNQSPTVAVTFHFDDGSSETQNITVSNWYYNNANQPRLAVGGAVPGQSTIPPVIGSIVRSSDSFTDYPGAMYEDDLTLAPTDQTKQLDSVSFNVLNYNGGSNNVAIYALSGEAYAPITTLSTQTYANNVTVQGDSNIDVTGSPNAVMGTLNIGSNALSVSSADTSGSAYSLAFSGGTNLTGNAKFNVANSAGGGKGMLNIGAVHGTGSVTKQGAGRLQMTNSGDITQPSEVDGGIVELDYSGSSPLSSIKSQIVSAYSGGAWNGTGITSAAAAAVAADSTNNHKTALGYAEASSIGEAEMAVLIRYTLSGDANLDGVVDSSDFADLAANYGKTSNVNWIQGDFNYDGTVNSLDFNALATNYGATPVADALPGALPAASLGALVPEPASMGLLGFGALGLLARRRREIRKA